MWVQDGVVVYEVTMLVDLLLQNLLNLLPFQNEQVCLERCIAEYIPVLVETLKRFRIGH